MPFAHVITPDRDSTISLELANRGHDYGSVGARTNASGYAVWLAEASNNFVNPARQSVERYYRKNGVFTEAFCDKIPGFVTWQGVHTGRFTYISCAGTENEREHKVRPPRQGWIVPTGDDSFIKGIWVPFYPDTLVPFATAEDMINATRMLESKGIAKEQISYFYRPENFYIDKFVIRDCSPVTKFTQGLESKHEDGWFCVAFDNGENIKDNVYSRPIYNGNGEIVMEVNL